MWKERLESAARSSEPRAECDAGDAQDAGGVWRAELFEDRESQDLLMPVRELRPCPSEVESLGDVLCSI